MGGRARPFFSEKRWHDSGTYTVPEPSSGGSNDMEVPPLLSAAFSKGRKVGSLP